MIFKNLREIVRDHYTSLATETNYTSPYSYLIIAILFVLIPTVMGFFLAKYVTVWTGFVTVSATVLSVLTGFTVNTIVLLMRYNKDGSHPYEKKKVKQTKEFTLYTLLLGVVLLASMTVGMILSQVDNTIPSEVELVTSGIIYSLLIHYFLTLLMITHRFWGLVHGDVLDE